MFGKNPLLKTDHGPGHVLHLVKGSPFYTIQGEGPYAGHPAVFIRLHGCNLACTFCDTNFSDPEDPVLNLTTILLKIKNKLNAAKLVVITGGEPLRQNILPLCAALHRNGLRVQIETAGTLWIEGLELFSDIICSPKTAKIHPEVYEHAIAFKYVISHSMKFNNGYIPTTATQAGTRPARLAEPRPGAPVYLSPMDEYDATKNANNQRQVVQLAMTYGCIAGIQLHKVLDISEPT